MLRLFGRFDAVPCPSRRKIHLKPSFDSWTFCTWCQTVCSAIQPTHWARMNVTLRECLWKQCTTLLTASNLDSSMYETIWTRESGSIGIDVSPCSLSLTKLSRYRLGFLAIRLDSFLTCFSQVFWQDIVDTVNPVELLNFQPVVYKKMHPSHWSSMEKIQQFGQFKSVNWIEPLSMQMAMILCFLLLGLDKHFNHIQLFNSFPYL